MTPVNFTAGHFNRLNDRFFKFLFANPDYKPLLIDFLNDILGNIPHGAERIAMIIDLEYIDRESTPAHQVDKLPRFDVRARAADGRIFHIEVQLRKERDIFPRVLYYGARNYVFATQRGQDYAPTQVICIMIADFLLFPETDSFHTVHRILNVEDGSWHLRGMEFHFIEIPKLRGRRSGPKTGLERVLYYLGNIGGEKTMQTIAAEDSRVAKMIELENLFRSDPDLLIDYLQWEDDRWDYETSLKESRAQGEALGEARGKVQGRLQTLIALVRDKLISVDVAAARAQMTEEEFISEMASSAARS